MTAAAAFWVMRGRHAQQRRCKYTTLNTANSIRFKSVTAWLRGGTRQAATFPGNFPILSRYFPESHDAFGPRLPVYVRPMKSHRVDRDRHGGLQWLVAVELGTFTQALYDEAEEEELDRHQHEERLETLVRI